MFILHLFYFIYFSMCLDLVQMRKLAVILLQILVKQTKLSFEQMQLATAAATTTLTEKVVHQDLSFVQRALCFRGPNDFGLCGEHRLNYAVLSTVAVVNAD